MFPVYPGDVIAVRGTGRFSDLIVRATGGYVSHVGMVIADEPPLVTEALFRVKTRPLEESIADCSDAWILRPRFATAYTRRVLMHSIHTYSSAGYGYFKILLHGLDALCRTQWFSCTFARSHSPICSWLVASAYEAVGYSFGESIGSLTPQDLVNHCTANPKKWEILRLKGNTCPQAATTEYITY